MLHANTDAPRKGATRAQRFSSNPLSELIQIMEQHKQGRRKLDAYRRYIRDKADELILNDPRFLEAIREYWFSNNFTNALKHVEPDVVDVDSEDAAPLPIKTKGKPDLRSEEQKARETVERERRKTDLADKLRTQMSAAITLRAVRLFDIKLPNGKTVWETSGTYIKAHADKAGVELGNTVRDALRVLGERLGARCPRDSNLSEQDVVEMVDEKRTAGK